MDIGMFLLTMYHTLPEFKYNTHLKRSQTKECLGGIEDGHPKTFTVARF